MTINQHQAVTFNDGEPLDPVKLNKLAKNIDNLYKMTSLANQTTGDGSLAVPLIFTHYENFREVEVGKVVTAPLPMTNTYSESEMRSGKIYVVASVRSGLGNKNSITVSVTGVKDLAPKIYLVNNGPKERNIAVDVIAVYMKEVSVSG
jgi:hypothetical protein